MFSLVRSSTLQHIMKKIECDFHETFLNIGEDIYLHLKTIFSFIHGHKILFDN